MKMIFALACSLVLVCVALVDMPAHSEPRLSAIQSPVGTVNLYWDVNPAAEQVTKYTVYQASSAAGPWTKIQDTTTAGAVVTGLAPGAYFFRVTATNIWGESGPSNVVFTPPSASNPGNLRIR